MSKKINRNSPCPCGSNKKYKHCCLQKNNQPARYTAEGKFKFSAEVLSSNQGANENSCSQLFQRLSGSLSIETNKARDKYYQITKNKSTIGKKTIKKAKAEEELQISKNLNKYNFEVMNTNFTDENLVSNQHQTQNASIDTDHFIPTQKDYRIKENMNSDLEENN